MNMTFTTGRHSYYGKFNGRAQRKRSKVYAGIKVNFKKLSDAFKKIEYEQGKTTRNS